MPVCGGSSMRSARSGTNLTSPAARISSSSLALSACRARRESRQELTVAHSALTWVNVTSAAL